MNTLLLIAMIAAILFSLILPGLRKRVLSVKKLLIMLVHINIVSWYKCDVVL